MGNPERPQVARYFATTVASIPREMMQTVLCSILQQDHRECVDRVTTPTLITQSQNDLLVPGSVAEYLHQRIAGSVLAEIEATGHLPDVSSPASVINAIRRFVD